MGLQHNYLNEANKKPKAADIQRSELVVNVVDKIIYSKDHNGEVVKVGSGEGETAQEILDKIKTVDGSGSGLDADMLDGKNSTNFANSSHTHSISQVDGLHISLMQKIESSNYATATYGGTLKARLDGTDLYISFDGTNP